MLRRPLLAALSVPSLARAQGQAIWPIVPCTPGGSQDVLGRLLRVDLAHGTVLAQALEIKAE